MTSERVTYAQSTIDATKWLIVYCPERLKAWLDRHAPGVEAEARRQIAERKRPADA